MSKRNFAKVFVVSLLAAPLLVLAHGSAGGRPEACAQGGMHKGGMPAGHGMMGSGHRQEGSMQGMGSLRGLDLTKEQQDQVFALMHGQMPTQRAKAQELHKAMGELRQLAAAERFDADKARVLSETVGKLQAEKALMRSEMQAKLRAVLTPEQRKKFDERMSSRQQGPQEWHQGGHRQS